MKGTVSAPPSGRPAPAPTSPRPTDRLDRALAWTGSAAPWAICLLGLLLTWVSQISLHLRGPWRILPAAVGLFIALTTFAALLRTRWWQARPVLALLAFTGCWALSAAVGYGSVPREAAKAAREEVVLMGAGLACAAALVVLAQASAVRSRGFRWLWLGTLLTTAPVAVREILTNQHIIVTKWNEWHFKPHIPAGTFANPNNFACVLVAVVGVLLAWSLDSVPRWASVLLLSLVGLSLWLIWATLSRGAFAAAAAQILVALLGMTARLGWWERIRRSRRARAAVIGTGVFSLLAAVAAFTVPALTAYNPFLRVAKAGEAESDDLRVQLIKTGVRYWETSPGFGIGPGSYEHRLGKEHPAWLHDPTINAHNGFVELLSQYGLLAIVPLAVLLVGACWYVVRPSRLRSGPDSDVLVSQKYAAPVVAARVDLACALIAFTITAVVVSSSLALPMWFVMLGHVVARAWELDAQRERPTGEQPAAPVVPAPAG